ncbi:MAG: SagB/ThcOx family dehydrogenase, partial [Phycisphaerae bacterium]|nr:SagB/ThcOx family dehydrogenase [Phycisphaerae bacterium]
LGQGMIGAGPVSIIMAADYGRTAKKYKARAKRYVHIEAGHIGQNIYLQAESLGLGTCAVGAFSDSQVKGLLGIAEEPVYVMPLGVPANNETKNH